MSEVKVKDKGHLVRETYSKGIIISTDFDDIIWKRWENQTRGSKTKRWVKGEN